jgi:hypothetical protein
MIGSESVTVNGWSVPTDLISNDSLDGLVSNDDNSNIGMTRSESLEMDISSLLDNPNEPPAICASSNSFSTNTQIKVENENDIILNVEHDPQSLDDQEEMVQLQGSEETDGGDPPVDQVEMIEDSLDNQPEEDDHSSADDDEDPEIVQPPPAKKPKCVTIPDIGVKIDTSGDTQNVVKVVQYKNKQGETFKILVKEDDSSDSSGDESDSDQEPGSSEHNYAAATSSS